MWIASGGSNGNILVWEVATRDRSQKCLSPSRPRAMGISFGDLQRTTKCIMQQNTMRVEEGDKWNSRSSRKLAAGTVGTQQMENWYPESHSLKMVSVCISGDRKDIRISDATTGDTVKQFAVLQLNVSGPRRSMTPRPARMMILLNCL